MPTESEKAAIAATLIERSDAIAARFAERVPETESLRRVPDASFRDLVESDLLKAVRPARYGGYELGMDVMTELIARLGRGCGSTAWVYGIYCDHAITIGMYPIEAQEDVWGDDPEAVVSSGLAPGGTVEKIEGGYRLDGRWQFSSGCDHAAWVFVHALAPSETEGGRPVPTYFLVPRSDWEIEDTWFVSGLVGTGSKDVIIRDAFVPLHRTLAIEDANGGTGPGGGVHPGLIYRLPRMPTVPFSLVSPAVGILDALIDAFVERTRGRSSRGFRLAEQAPIQMRVAESSAERDCAWLLLRRANREIMESMETIGAIPPEQQARNRRDMAYIAGLCSKAADRLYSITGANGLFDGNDTRRMFLDIRAIAAHHVNAWDIAAPLYGRSVFGLDAV